MLNFTRLNIVFICLIGACLAAVGFFGYPFYGLIILVLAYLLLFSYGCYYIGSNFFVRVICRVKTKNKVIALTFDDGPDAANTPIILEILKGNYAEAAFFCVGARIDENAGLLRQVYDAGHLIGNHTYSHHTWFDLFPAGKMLDDMNRMDQATARVITKTPKLFRPPYGVTNPAMRRATVKGNYTPVGWSVRSYDTVIKNERRLLSRVVRRLKPGAVFLFHDRCPVTVAILPEFINHVKSKGFEIIRLDKMLNLQPYV
jgi:peptidoglycan-N-acetylglucosamine deacetylase